MEQARVSANSNAGSKHWQQTWLCACARVCYLPGVGNARQLPLNKQRMRYTYTLHTLPCCAGNTTASFTVAPPYLGAAARS